MTYDGLSDFDLTDGGVNDSFGFLFTASDSVTQITDVVTLSITDDGFTSAVTFSVPGSDALSQQTSIGFDQFSGVDFTSVDAVELSFDFAGLAGRDFSLDFFGATTAVPEPSAIGFSLVAMMGLALVRRRK